MEEVGVLRNQADGAPQALLRHLTDVLAVDPDRARGHIVHAHQQAHQRRLARAARTNESHALAGRDMAARNP